MIVGHGNPRAEVAITGIRLRGFHSKPDVAPRVDSPSVHVPARMNEQITRRDFGVCSYNYAFKCKKAWWIAKPDGDPHPGHVGRAGQSSRR